MVFGQNFNSIFKGESYLRSHYSTLMASYKAHINIMPLEALLDPQGKAVTGSMTNIGLAEISHVRIGKHITMSIDAKDKKTAEGKVEEACKKLLCNEIMEYFSFEIEEVK